MRRPSASASSEVRVFASGIGPLTVGRAIVVQIFISPENGIAIASAVGPSIQGREKIT
jgi:hypothetical protein